MEKLIVEPKDAVEYELVVTYLQQNNIAFKIEAEVVHQNTDDVDEVRQKMYDERLHPS